LGEVKQESGKVFCMVQPNRHHLWIGGWKANGTGFLDVWSVAERRMLKSLPSPHLAGTLSLLSSAIDNSIYCSSWDQTISIWKYGNNS